VTNKQERVYLASLRKQKVPVGDGHLQDYFWMIEERCMAKMLEFDGVDPHLIVQILEKPAAKKTRAEKQSKKGKSAGANLRNPTGKKVVTSVNALGKRVRAYKLKIRAARKEDVTGDPSYVELMEYADCQKLEKELVAERPADQSALTQFFAIGKKKKNIDAVANSESMEEQEEAEDGEEVDDGEEEK
jgi:hypothetical protein